MDEITVDMDVLGRMDLLEFFKQECEQRGATIIYATHIFDGLEQWITHIAYLEEGRLVKGECRGLQVVERLRQTERLQTELLVNPL
jgi:CCR4-NOT complex subunit CAF16